ncbi:hypothetical protein Taro_041954, partial [Colocasia esculenta]|nr:hypothetical protein [Colocasia esculenta]
QTGGASTIRTTREPLACNPRQAQQARGTHGPSRGPSANQGMHEQARTSEHHQTDTATKVSPSVTEHSEATCHVPHLKVLRANLPWGTRRHPNRNHENTRGNT